MLACASRQVDRRRRMCLGIETPASACSALGDRGGGAIEGEIGKNEPETESDEVDF